MAKLIARPTHCSTLQHTATHCNTLHYTATYCNILQQQGMKKVLALAADGKLIAPTHCKLIALTHCNIQQHATTHCNTLQHAEQQGLKKVLALAADGKLIAATHCKLIALTHCNTLQHAATHCNTLHHTATHCITLQHTATTGAEESASASSRWQTVTGVRDRTSPLSSQSRPHHYTTGCLRESDSHSLARYCPRVSHCLNLPRTLHKLTLSCKKNSQSKSALFSIPTPPLFKRLCIVYFLSSCPVSRSQMIPCDVHTGYSKWALFQYKCETLFVYSL